MKKTLTKIVGILTLFLGSCQTTPTTIPDVAPVKTAVAPKYKCGTCTLKSIPRKHTE